VGLSVILTIYFSITLIPLSNTAKGKVNLKDFYFFKKLKKFKKLEKKWPKWQAILFRKLKKIYRF